MVVAMYDFEDNEEQMLSLTEGTKVSLLEEAPDGEWGRGRTEDGREGWFPLG